MKYFLLGLLGLGSYTGAHALDFQCGKTIEVVAVPASDRERRPSLLVNIETRPDGTVIKRYKPMAAANEAVGDFLMGITGTAQVCIKYYDPMLPAPVPLLVLDIYREN